MANNKNNNKYKFTSCIGSIDYVRVNKIDDDKPGQPIYGSVMVQYSRGNEVVYHRTSVKPDIKGPGEYLFLTGPSKVIETYGYFHISVALWVKLCDQGCTKEIANGEITWNPRRQDLYEKPLQRKIRGKHGSVMVGFSVIERALSATVEVVMMNELAAQIYGTIKAVRVLVADSGESSITQMLFDKSADECVQLNPQQSIPLTRPLFPVQVDYDFTIAIDLRSHANDEIAQGSLQFTPIVGTQTMNITGKYGQVQVSITCKD